MGEGSESVGVKCLEVEVEGVRVSSDVCVCAESRQDKNKMSLNFRDIC